MKQNRTDEGRPPSMSMIEQQLPQTHSRLLNVSGVNIRGLQIECVPDHDGKVADR